LEIKDIFVGFTVAPSQEDVSEISRTILDSLPEGLLKYIGKLKIQVEDFPDTFIEQEMELETPFDLLGCYQSCGPTAIGHLASRTKQQDTLYLYRRPILDVWVETGEDIAHVINRVMIREIGHHFGFSADEIEMYEEDMFDATAPGIGVS